MDMQPVDSSLISHLGYDAETCTMAVCFTHGQRTYLYPNVPPIMYESLRQARSVGAHFSRFIRGTYAGVLQDGEEEADGTPDGK